MAEATVATYGHGTATASGTTDRPTKKAHKASVLVRPSFLYKRGTNGEHTTATAGDEITGATAPKTIGKYSSSNDKAADNALTKAYATTDTTAPTSNGGRSIFMLTRRPAGPNPRTR